MLGHMILIIIPTPFTTLRERYVQSPLSGAAETLQALTAPPFCYYS